MVRTILLLGSNLGDRLLQLRGAKEALRLAGTVVAQSSVYETAPWGNTGQPAFLNQVVALDTELDPFALLKKLQSIEQAHGRERREKWGARTLDIDILFFGRIVVETDDLIIPHPGIAERRFTLVPLAELQPELLHPVMKVTVAELLSRCADSSDVQRWNV